MNQPLDPRYAYLTIHHEKVVSKQQPDGTYKDFWKTTPIPLVPCGGEVGNQEDLN